MKFKLINNISAWLVFLIASFVYISTIEPTASLWDCGEFIATAYKLEVGHPPGAPLFMILARIASLFAGNDVTAVAKMVNTLSALSSAFTILFLFWTITHFAKKLVPNKENMDLSNLIAVIGSGVVGALAYTFTDSFWFSAVEGEVYAMSSLFTAIVFWSILKWENEADKTYSNRWLILIAYLVGLSIGVHLLNLLAIPAIVFVYYFRNYKPTPKGIVISSALSIMLLVVIMYGIIPGVITMASRFELLLVNTLGFGFKTGVFVFVLLMVISVIGTIYYTSKENTNHLVKSILFAVSTFLLGTTMFLGSLFMAILLSVGVFSIVYLKGKDSNVLLNNIILATTVIMIGYSSFSMIVIRSLANPPLDENNPENVFALLSYLNREQYGDRPLFYGQYYNAPLKEYKDTSPVYAQSTVDGKDKYVIVDKKKKAIYDDRFTTVFPRMYSEQAHHKREYIRWGNVDQKRKPIYVTTQSGRTPYVKPSFAENITFFIRYQIGFMYMRYFAWNFIGRQNDMQGHGEINKGGWISGVPGLGMETNYKELPRSIKDNKGRNMYYFLPFLLGLLGLFYMFTKSTNEFWVVMLLFLFTGLAIVVYLNQYPMQPRERDYAFAGSFYAFAIWIGIGVFALYELISKKIPKNISSAVAVIASLLLVPTIMANQNWDDHDRSNRYTARDIAKNYLASCAPNAIIFTNGDNDTFPLWYVQEVEGYRTDVRVVNLSLLNTDWYIEQMKRKAYESEPVPFSLTKEQYGPGQRTYMPIVKVKGIENQHIPVYDVVKWVASDDKKTQVETTGGRFINAVPAKKYELAVPKAKVLANGTVKQVDSNKIVDKMRWTYPKNYMAKADFMVLDLIANNNWERPIYFAMTVGPDNYFGLEKYFQLDGMAYRLVPIESNGQGGQAGRIDTDILYNKLMNEFVWGNIGAEDVYLDEQNIRMTMNLRGNFTRLAKALVLEGDSVRATEVLDKCLEVIPKDKVPFNYYALGMIESYYRLGNKEKARIILFNLYENEMDNLNWYTSLPMDEQKWINNDIKRSKAVVGELYRMSLIFNDEETSNKLKEDGAEEIIDSLR